MIVIRLFFDKLILGVLFCEGGGRISFHKRQPTFSRLICVQFLFSIELLFSDIFSSAGSLIFEILNLSSFFDNFFTLSSILSVFPFYGLSNSYKSNVLFLAFSIQIKHASPQRWRDPSDPILFPS